MAKKCRCELKPNNEFVAFDGAREIVGNDKIVAYAESHRMLLRCNDCFGMIADYRRGGRGYVGDLRQLGSQSNQRGQLRKPRERTAVIRNVSGGEVSFRYFGESYGLKQRGIDFSKLEGFRGSGLQLSTKLGMTGFELARELKISTEELIASEYDISKN